MYVQSTRLHDDGNGSVRRRDCRSQISILARGGAFLLPGRLAPDTPEIHGGVGTPWPPAFRPHLQISRPLQADRSQEAEIAGGESIRLAHRPHGHVLHSPLANPGDLTELILK